MSSLRGRRKISPGMGSVSKRAEKRDSAELLRQEKEQKLGAAMADAIVDPFARVAEVAKAHGLSDYQVRGLLDGLKREHLPVKLEIQKFTNQALIDELGDGVARGVRRMRERIEHAGDRDAAYMFKELFNAWRLMKGEPTAIVSVDERKKLNELLPDLIRESRRRGIIIDAQAMVVPEPPPEPKRIEAERIE